MVIGAAFSKIVTAFTEDIIMPLINPLLARTGKSWREWTIPPGIRIGDFLGSVLDFLIVAFALYLAIRAIARFKHKEETA